MPGALGCYIGDAGQGTESYLDQIWRLQTSLIGESIARELLNFFGELDFDLQVLCGRFVSS